MNVLRFSFLLFLLYFFSPTQAAETISADSSARLNPRLNQLMRQIDLQKSRIRYNFDKADKNFFRLVDSLTGFILYQPVDDAAKQNYLNTLIGFLSGINKPTQNEYFESGRYLQVMNYFPKMIEWSQKGVLLNNLSNYQNFSLKALALVPSDAVLDTFLQQCVLVNPDEVLRNADDFYGKSFDEKLVNQICLYAPVSVSRYLGGYNRIKQILSRSNLQAVKTIFNIFDRDGVRSKAYLLIDPITRGELTISDADALATDPVRIFKRVLNISKRKEPSGQYSIRKELEQLSIAEMRSINDRTLNNNSPSAYEQFNKYDQEETFLILLYGFKETAPKTFQNLFNIFKRKSTQPLSHEFIAALDKTKLSTFLQFCDKNNLLKEVLSMTSEGDDKVLVAAMTETENLDLFPPLYSFDYTTKAIIETLNLDLIPDTAKVARAKRQADSLRLAERKKVEPITTNKPNNPSVGLNKIAIPDDVEIPVEPIKVVLDAQEKKIIELKKNIFQTIQNIPLFISEKYAAEILLYAAQKEPDELFKKVDYFKRNFYCVKILEVCALNAPSSFKRYLVNSGHPVNYILHSYSKDPVVAKMFDINEQVGFQTKSFLLMDEIINEKIKVKDALSISSSPEKLFTHLSVICAKEKCLGRYNAEHELTYYSLRFIRDINDKLAQGKSQSFDVVDGFTAEELYSLMVYGREEVFTSTFGGLFSRLIQKIGEGNGTSFLQGIHYNKYRTFLSLCANNGRLQNFLELMKLEERRELLKKFTNNIESEADDLNAAAMVAETLSNLKDKQLLSILQLNLKSELGRVKEANSPTGIALYGTLIKLISSNAVVENAWFNRTAKQFKTVALTYFPFASALNAEKHCTEQMYFYNDADGRDSYNNFLATFRNLNDWHTEDKGNYIRTYSTAGNRIDIFANKPEYEDNGIQAINSYLNENQLSPTFVVHRGHSFHTEKTLTQVTSATKLIFVGSCGGFYKISIAMENAPDAHIIATKQIGTKQINDPIILGLNESIRKGKDIVWADFWESMKAKLGSNPYFADYVPPHKNLESLFIRAYYQLLGI